jgi:hypothetical protein
MTWKGTGSSHSPNEVIGVVPCLVSMLCLLVCRSVIIFFSLLAFLVIWEKCCVLHDSCENDGKSIFLIVAAEETKKFHTQNAMLKYNIFR